MTNTHTHAHAHTQRLEHIKCCYDRNMNRKTQYDKEESLPQIHLECLFLQSQLKPKRDCMEHFTRISSALRNSFLRKGIMSRHYTSSFDLIPHILREIPRHLWRVEGIFLHIPVLMQVVLIINCYVTHNPKI